MNLLFGTPRKSEHVFHTVVVTQERPTRGGIAPLRNPLGEAQCRAENLTGNAPAQRREYIAQGSKAISKSLPHDFVLKACHHDVSAAVSLAAAAAVELAIDAARVMGFSGKGRNSEASTLQAELEAQSKQRYLSPAMLAGVEFAAGNTDSGFQLLQEAVDVRAREVIFMRGTRMLKGHRDDPRYAALLAAVGL